MTEICQKCDIMKTNKIKGTKKDSQRVQVVLATLLYRSPDSRGEHLP